VETFLSEKKNHQEKTRLETGWSRGNLCNNTQRKNDFRSSLSFYPGGKDWARTKGERRGDNNIAWETWERGQNCPARD